MATTVEPIRFRCPECNQLLGAPPRKVGGTVHCPKCKAPLIVPEPEPEPTSIAGQDDDPDPSRVFRDMFRVDPPSEEFPDFTPADIRAAIGFDPPIVTGSTTMELPASEALVDPPIPPPEPVVPVSKKKAKRPAPPEPPSEESAFPMIRTEPVSLRPDRPRPAKIELPPPTPFPEIRVEPPPMPPIVAQPAVVPEITVEAPPPPGGLPPIIAEPPIVAEPASVLVERSGPRRSDVVLPRTAVLLWSFFAVLALVTSFAAGLLLGHYVWVSRATGG